MQGEDGRTAAAGRMAAEGELEDGTSGLGEIQGGNMEIVDAARAEGWAERLKETEELLHRD